MGSGLGRVPAGPPAVLSLPRARPPRGFGRHRSPDPASRRPAAVLGSGKLAGALQAVSRPQNGHRGPACSVAPCTGPTAAPGRPGAPWQPQPGSAQVMALPRRLSPSWARGLFPRSAAVLSWQLRRPDSGIAVQLRGLEHTSCGSLLVLEHGPLAGWRGIAGPCTWPQALGCSLLVLEHGPARARLSSCPRPEHAPGCLMRAVTRA